jgi:hypothetical protein
VSTFRPAKVRCRCGGAYSVEVAEGLHVSLRPDLRQAILEGAFHRFTCPSCEAVSLVEDVLAYTDFPRRQWFTVVPRSALPRRRAWIELADTSFRQTMVERAAPVATTWAPEMTRRLIFGLASLREKLFLFDAGLDDRVVEQLKLQLIVTRGLGFAEDEYFHVVDLEGGALVLEHSHPDGGVFTLLAPLSLYDRLLADRCGGGAARAASHDLVIDYRAALSPEAPEAARE